MPPVRGDARWFVERSARYARERRVFDRPIGQNQGVQFPIADAHIEAEAADLMRWRACELFDAHQPCGAEANMAKYLAAKASWEAANTAIQTHGGFGFACEYDIERKFRETRLYQVAPISTNLIPRVTWPSMCLAVVHPEKLPCVHWKEC
jgi:acyl-CoA dehydrogenase